MENKKRKFSVKARLKSFSYAGNGFKILFQSEHNAIIHLIAMCCAISLGFFFQISLLEWVAIVGVIGFVFVAEIFNTSIEYLADFVSPERRSIIKKVKDLAAAAVLVAAITALVVGGIIFIPKI